MVLNLGLALYLTKGHPPRRSTEWGNERTAGSSEGVFQLSTRLCAQNLWCQVSNACKIMSICGTSIPLITKDLK